MRKVHEKLIDPAELAAWVSACVAIGMHAAGSLPLTGEVLGGVITAAILPVAMIAVRLLARVIGQAPDDESGFITLPALGALVGVAILLMVVLEGCGSTYTVKTGGWRLEALPSGAACLHVHGDGEEITRVCIENPEPLRLPPATVARICQQP